MAPSDRLMAAHPGAWSWWFLRKWRAQCKCFGWPFTGWRSSLLRRSQRIFTMCTHLCQWSHRRHKFWLTLLCRGGGTNSWCPGQRAWNWGCSPCHPTCPLSWCLWERHRPQLSCPLLWRWLGEDGSCEDVVCVVLDKCLCVEAAAHFCHAQNIVQYCIACVTFARKKQEITHVLPKFNFGMICASFYFWQNPANFYCWQDSAKDAFHCQKHWTWYKVHKFHHTNCQKWVWFPKIKLGSILLKIKVGTYRTKIKCWHNCGQSYLPS